MCTNAMRIARRHLAIIVQLADMAERGEPVDELVRATVRNCLLAMQSTGTDAAEAAEILEHLLQQELSHLEDGHEQARKLLDAAHWHAEYLTVARASDKAGQAHRP
ncbi:hypothetical protein [Herbaspirillum camelliae]|uniref:hypothetical protein n=1 Tax=Herbaspirillum camelliae TaxID=1892903 RepID=UPI000949CD09|nr:hypothetical protein [Herbaspirillum camelliae]